MLGDGLRREPLVDRPGHCIRITTGSDRGCEQGRAPGPPVVGSPRIQCPRGPLSAATHRGPDCLQRPLVESRLNPWRARRGSRGRPRADRAPSNRSGSGASCPRAARRASCAARPDDRRTCPEPGAGRRGIGHRRQMSRPRHQRRTGVVGRRDEDELVVGIEEMAQPVPGAGLEHGRPVQIDRDHGWDRIGREDAADPAGPASCLQATGKGSPACRGAEPGAEAEPGTTPTVRGSSPVSRPAGSSLSETSPLGESERPPWAGGRS